MSTTTFNIHPKLSKCNICSKECYIVDINVTKHDSLNGCDVIKCNKCHSVWYICAVHNNRFSMSNKSKMVKHFTTLHSQPALKATTSLYGPVTSTNLTKKLIHKVRFFSHLLMPLTIHQFHLRHYLQTFMKEKPLIIILNRRTE